MQNSKVISKMILHKNNFRYCNIPHKKRKIWKTKIVQWNG